MTDDATDQQTATAVGAPPGEVTASPLEFITAASAGTLTDRMGIRLTEISPGRVVGEMPVAGNTQPYGLLHGGASCVLAETLASLGAAMHAGPTGSAVGIEINATHHRSARDGVVTGVATALHLGRSVACYEVTITDAADVRLCTARVTCMVRT